MGAGSTPVSTSPTVLTPEERAELEQIIETSEDPAQVKTAMERLGYDSTAQGNIGKRRGLDLSKPLAKADLTDKALRDARNAEFARNRSKRGRRSQFLTDTGWEDPVGALTPTSGNLGDIGLG